MSIWLIFLILWLPPPFVFLRWPLIVADQIDTASDDAPRRVNRQEKALVWIPPQRFNFSRGCVAPA